MSVAQIWDTDDIHPIDIAEDIALDQAWEFDRIAHDQIAVTLKGLWRSYDLTLAYGEGDDTLRLVCSFQMEPPKTRLSMLYEVINLANDNSWGGFFTYWDAQNLMVYRYGLLLAGGQMACADQIDNMLNMAVRDCETYYPAFQLATWGEKSPSEAIKTAFCGTVGSA